MIAEGIPIETGRTVTGAENGRLALGPRTEGPFDLVVDALGTGSPLRPSLPGTLPLRHLEFGAVWGTVPLAGGRLLDPLHRLEHAPVQF